MRTAFVLFALFFLPYLAMADTCPSLSLGSTGASVSAVQKILFDAYDGFPNPTGYFGAVTQTAVKQWQSEHGILQTGTVGPLTAKAMAICTISNVPAPTASLSAAAANTVLQSGSASTRTLKQGNERA